jgi:hypothetical protein
VECNFCGHPITPEDQFCGGCGAQLEAPGAIVKEPSAGVEKTPPSPGKTNVALMGCLGVAVGVFLLVLMVALGVGVWWYLQPKPGPTSPVAQGSPLQASPATPPTAGPPATPPETGGDDVAALLKEAGINYEVSSSTGNYRITLDVGGGRTHLVIVGKNTENYRGQSWREIWARAYRSDQPKISAELANRLLRDSFEATVGDWETLTTDKGGVDVLYCIKVHSLDSPAQLKAYVEYCARKCDALEKELVGTDDL